MWLRIVSLVLALCASAAPVSAGEYPDHAVKMIVPFAAGGGTDVLARIIAQNLNSKWGQPVVVENQPGASGAIGSRAVMNAAPDGYTLLMASTGALMAVSSAADGNGPFDVNQVLTPIVIGAAPPYLPVGGAQGIGKDTLLEPVKHAVGPWNFHDVSPTHLLGRFNGFVKSTILRVSEARDLGDVDRFSFYDHTKIYTAAPPDVLRVDEKNLREYYVFNCLGFIVTTNHKTDGIYLPADDRRHFVAWSQRTKEEFSPQYWNELWGWYQAGGYGHVGAYLTEFDLAGFDAKAPPPKTAAFWDIVNANNAPEDAELADVLDALGNPDALTLRQLIEHAIGTEAADWLTDRRNRRAVPHRMERCGYAPVRNPYADDGLWKFQDRRQVVYAKARLSLRDQIVAVRKLL